MATEDTLGARYEQRRKARGAEPPPERKAWRRRLILIGAGALAVVLLVVGLFVWLAWTRVGTVRTTVAAAVINVPSRAEGRLGGFRVSTHDQVQAGQALVEFDDPQLTATLHSAEATVALDQSLYDQAVADIELTKKRVDNGIKTATAVAEAATARVEQAQRALEMRQSRLVEEIRRAQAERDQSKADLAHLLKGARQEEILASQARVEAAEALLALYELEVRQSEQLVGEGIDSQFILETKRTQLITQQKVTRQAELELQRLRAGPTPEETESGTQMLNAREAALALAQAAANEVENLKSDLVIRQAELRQARAELENANASEVQKALAAERMEAAKATLGRAEDDLAARQDAMSIKSPVTGRVVRVFNHVGDTCRAGEVLLQVTNDSQGRWISAYVREKDAFYVHPGQRAKVKLASGERVAAAVVSVGGATSSLDRQRTVGTDESEQVGPELVRVKLIPLQPLRSDPLPGMSARAVILIRTKVALPETTEVAGRT
jgi:multidrug resistance efflux pump